MNMTEQERRKSQTKCPYYEKLTHDRLYCNDGEEQVIRVMPRIKRMGVYYTLCCDQYRECAEYRRLAEKGENSEQ